MAEMTDEDLMDAPEIKKMQNAIKRVEKLKRELEVRSGRDLKFASMAGSLYLCDVDRFHNNLRSYPVDEGGSTVAEIGDRAGWDGGDW